MYIDTHTHPFHPKIAQKVLEYLHSHYDIAPIGTGLAEDLVMRLRRAGLQKAVALCAATTVEQVGPANAFALQLAKDWPDDLIPFGALHPHCKDWQEHLSQIKQAGLKGLKFHPEFQSFHLDDPALFPILEEIGEDLMVMCHVGDRLPPAENPSCPYKLEALRQRFPKVRFIAAHLGGYLHWEHALKSYIGKPVYIDTSSSLNFLEPEMIREILRLHPREFVLFGSDYPLFDPSDEIKLLEQKAGLSEAEIDVILGNAARALGEK